MICTLGKIINLLIFRILNRIAFLQELRLECSCVKCTTRRVSIFSSKRFCHGMRFLTSSETHSYSTSTLLIAPEISVHSPEVIGPSQGSESDGFSSQVFLLFDRPFRSVCFFPINTTGLLSNAITRSPL